MRVAFANPLDFESRAALEFQLGLKIEVAIAEEAQLVALLTKKLNAFEEQSLQSVLSEAPITIAGQPGLAQFESNVMSTELDAALVVRLVNKVLSDAVEAGASDIHLEPEPTRLLVRVRVDGIMRELTVIPQALQQSILSRMKLLCGMDISEKRKPQDGRLRLKTGQGVRDLRVSTLPTAYGESLVARILSSDFSRLSFESLALPSGIEGPFREVLRSSSRVIVVTGPTGSGKTTTLYTALLSLRDGQRNILTVEDPIEYRLQGINQVQVNSKIGMGFAESLRSILRQDPDVVMIGEIRDQETASIAMQAAQTGHLVLSTLHTNSASAAVTRLVDLGVPFHSIAASLGGILAQRLARRLCESCCQPLPIAEWERYRSFGFSDAMLGRVRTALGCTRCGTTGYAGRVGIYSYLEIDDPVREAIRQNLGEDEIERRARLRSFRSLAEDACDLLAAGVTSLEEIERVVGPLERALQESRNRLPRAQAAETLAAGASEAGASLRKRHVLLVEDDPNMRAILSMVFEREMYEVTEAENGHVGLSKVHERVPDLVVCDVMMPQLDGRSFVRKLRADPRTANLPVLMLTAASSEENEVSLLASGADDFVSKTADTKVMLARVERLLSRATRSG